MATYLITVGEFMLNHPVDALFCWLVYAEFLLLTCPFSLFLIHSFVVSTAHVIILATLI